MTYDGKFGPELPLIAAGYGLKTQHGILLPPGGRVAAYVRSTGLQNLDDSAIAPNLVYTLADALKRCRSGGNDIVMVLPGHSESVSDTTMLDNLVNGTRIIGVGEGSSMPTFRWTGTAAQWVIDNNDVVITGLRLRLEGANGIVKAIAVTGTDVAIQGNDIEFASGASNKATIGIEVGVGGDRFTFRRNRGRGTATHNVTDGLKIAAAVTECEITGNVMQFSATAANGLIHVTSAATRLLIAGNILYNTHTSSTSGITVDNVAADGVIADNRIGLKAAGTLTSNTSGLSLGAAALVLEFQNFVADSARSSGILMPAADT